MQIDVHSIMAGGATGGKEIPMPLTKDQIRVAALELDPVEREALAEELLLSISDGEREAIDAAWLAEARLRDAAYQRGETTAKDPDEVIRRLKAGGGARS
jgi:hypothetical protein